MAKVNNIHLDENIKILELDKYIVEILAEHEVKIVRDIWQMSRKDLKAMGFKDSEIKHITIKLQLLGLDLNKKVYN